MDKDIRRLSREVRAHSVLEKILLIVCFSGSVFFIGSALPLVQFIIRKQDEALKDYWNSGVGQQMFFLGFLLVVSGIGILLEKRWPKFILIGLCITFVAIILLNCFYST
ncbi:MAG: hypothetical protein JW928_01220 [Candidatus Aureabacteria bacterium]|nr:hypothetical protein [Candidatus Auribacterota bacterium]